MRHNCLVALVAGGLTGYLASKSLPLATFAAAVHVVWILMFCTEETT